MKKIKEVEEDQARLLKLFDYLYRMFIWTRGWKTPSLRGDGWPSLKQEALLWWS